MPKFLYNIEIHREGRSPVVIDWGNSPQWIKAYHYELAEADVIVLEPKPGVDLPTVRTAIPDGAHWVITSRVIGTIGVGSIRVYGLGYKQGLKKGKKLNGKG